MPAAGPLDGIPRSPTSGAVGEAPSSSSKNSAQNGHNPSPKPCTIMSFNPRFIVQNFFLFSGSGHIQKGVMPVRFLATLSPDPGCGRGALRPEGRYRFGSAAKWWLFFAGNAAGEVAADVVPCRPISF